MDGELCGIIYGRVLCSVEEVVSVSASGMCVCCGSVDIINSYSDSFRSRVSRAEPCNPFEGLSAFPRDHPTRRAVRHYRWSLP